MRGFEFITCFYFLGGFMKKESDFQTDLVDDIEAMFPGSIVIKNDPSYIQGFPDLTILYKNKWAALEAKRSKTSKHRPNQDYYVELLNQMSFAAFIYPENREEVLLELQRALES